MEPSNIDLNDTKTITKFFTALGDPTRLQIAQFLGNHGKSNVSEIASQFDISRPSISHHLKILKEARIVDSKKSGQEVYYWLLFDVVSANLQVIADALRSLKCHD
ncbi:ArsR/SmtB family transcription factor [Marininema halotolerans]|uniref:DNA-binding transcriptional regulator, ArsR family n=1 Tax=Marininema halotolerans TaxID=1155944 RepID=A0A1I6U2A2_9BACL|nr:metalloregulator ArsR/SmtB family transcription factor [Marininema halotolerans]SFS95541.1 DNA-binding transcriptional regulator, ArsR family [Marininema halotolerans]